MSKTIYLKEGIVKVNYKPLTRVMYVLWKNLFDQNIVRECCEAQLKQVQKGAKIIVVDISKTKGVLMEETQKWLKDKLFPLYARAGLRAIITIDSETPLPRLAAKRWTKEGEDFSFDMVIVKTKEEAVKAVSEYL